MTRPRQHLRRVKTKQGIVPRIINKGVTWVKRHFSNNPQTGDLTSEEAQRLLFLAAQRRRREIPREYERVISGQNLREPEDIRLLRQRLRLKYPESPREGV